MLLLESKAEEEWFIRRIGQERWQHWDGSKQSSENQTDFNYILLAGVTGFSEAFSLEVREERSQG